MTVLAQRSEQFDPLVGRIFAAAQAGAVFSPPVVSGAYTVITASQVVSGGGFGSGVGFGPARARGAEGEGADATGPGPAAGGGGLGGGGGASGRPVAVIVIGPDGVKVKPIVDATQIVLAAVTTGAAMAGMLLRLRRRGRAM
jgi:uncharacterized spore protein YtfJ